MTKQAFYWKYKNNCVFGSFIIRKEDFDKYIEKTKEAEWYPEDDYYYFESLSEDIVKDIVDFLGESPEYCLMYVKEDEVNEVKEGWRVWNPYMFL